MKPIKKSLLALAALATAIGGTVHADNVYIVGAQAARTTVNPVISALSDATIVATSGADLTPTNVNNATWNLWRRSDGSFIAAYWNGGEAAVRSLLATNPAFAQVPFIATNQTGSVATNAITDLHQPQIAVANNGAAYSRFNGTTLSQIVPGSTTASRQKYNKAASDTVVDVSTYGFAADRSFTNTGVSSISAAQARVLFKYGNAPLSLFTGNPNDDQATVWLQGRDIDAGARVNIFNFTGYGGLNATFNHQAFAWVTNSGVKTISAIGLVPATVIDGIIQPAGNGGYAQGSDSIKNVYPVVSGTALQYVTSGNKQIIAYQTNFTATNLVTNPAVGSNSVYSGSALTPVDPGTNVVYTVKTQGTTAKPTVFKGISYYISALSTNVNPTSTIAKPLNGYLITNSVNITNNWNKSGANYILTYESLVNIGNSKNTNANGQLPILLSYEGVGANAQIASSSVAAAVATNHVENGGYTAWNYDHLLLNTNGLNSASVVSVQTWIQSYLATNVALPNLKLSDLKVNSTGDGATPYPKGLTNQ